MNVIGTISLPFIYHNSAQLSFRSRCNVISRKPHCILFLLRPIGDNSLSNRSLFVFKSYFVLDKLLMAIVNYVVLSLSFLCAATGICLFLLEQLVTFDCTYVGIHLLLVLVHIGSSIVLFIIFDYYLWNAA